jgi:hypothetical protein
MSLNELFLAGNILYTVLLKFQDFLESPAPDPRRSIPGEEEFSQDSRLVTLENLLIFLTVCCSGSLYDLFIRINVGVANAGHGSLRWYWQYKELMWQYKEVMWQYPGKSFCACVNNISDYQG